jgi:hypothetical protein
MNIVAPFYGSQKIKEEESIWLEKSLKNMNYSDRIGRAVQEEDRVFYSSFFWALYLRVNFSSQQSGHHWNFLSTQLPQEQIHWFLSASTNMISPPLNLKILNNILR